MTRRRREEELDRDIREHLEMEIRDNLERGMAPEAARAAALRKFGNVARIKEDTRAVWGWMWVAQVLQDIRYALRLLRKNPGFATVTTVTLALGIGMNTAVFSVVNAVLLKPLPYPNAERLVWLADYNERFKMEAVAGPDFLDWKAQAQSFEKMAGYGYGRGTISINGNADQAMNAFVTDDFWSITGAQPSPGRTFAPGERGVVILGRGIFERRLGSDRNIIGKSVTLDGRAVTVVGVMPPGFRFQFPQSAPSVTEQTEVDAYEPSDLSPANQVRGRNMAIVNVVAKLKTGTSIQQAHAEMDAIQARIARENPKSFYDQVTLRVVPLQEKLVGNARRALLVLLAAVGFVLLIACANIANLLLARASSRQKEIAMRAALGAERLRVVWQFLAEGVVLAVLGGALGLLLARWGIVLMLRLGPQAVPRLAETAMDGRVLGFTFAVSLLTGLLFGLGPALACSQTKLHHVLKEGGWTSAGSAGLRLRRLLVGGELALALVLLIGAGLMLKSFWRMNARPAGFQPESILVMRVSLSGPNYRSMPQQFTYIEQALRRLEAAPGVQAAGIANSTVRGVVGVEGAPPFPPGQGPQTTYNTRSAGYFRAMGVPLLKGRWMTDTETRDVVLINERFARVVFGASDPIGRRIRVPRQQPAAIAEIVGVVADLKATKLDADPEPEVYVPYRQSIFVRMADVVVKTAGNPLTMASVLREQVASIDRTQPVYHVETLEQALADSISPRRFNLFLLGVFAVVAVVLGAVGIYGVMSYMVTQRTQEIGVRMALGAQQGEVLRMVVREGMWVATAGILCGVAASLALTRLMGSLLYEVTATDPSTFAVVCLALGVAALVACCAPAVKAARVDPIVALRYE
ncbi:MAG TPA: ABC transporter permease [Bryobacteraceae bacterium]|nr:ABC transporter permease [Bryobacteraceae bacterium]